MNKTFRTTKYTIKQADADSQNLLWYGPWITKSKFTFIFPSDTLMVKYILLSWQPWEFLRQQFYHYFPAMAPQLLINVLLGQSLNCRKFMYRLQEDQTLLNCVIGSKKNALLLGPSNWLILKNCQKYCRFLCNNNHWAKRETASCAAVFMILLRWYLSCHLRMNRWGKNFILKRLRRDKRLRSIQMSKKKSYQNMTK